MNSDYRIPSLWAGNAILAQYILVDTRMRPYSKIVLKLGNIILFGKNTIWLYWASVFCLTIMNVYFSALTWEEIRSTVGWVRHIPQKSGFKFRHIVQYGPQTFFLAWATTKYFKSSYVSASFIGLAYVVIIGTLGEVIQYFTPSRIPSVFDVFWNFLGGVVGVFVFFIYSQVKKQYKTAI